MSSTVTRVSEESEQEAPATLSVTLSREQLALCTVVVVQAVYLGWAMMRGWYSAADLPNIAFANGRSLDWDYLTSTLGGHFGVAQRLVYWLLNRAAPLEWWFTVLIRLVFQALTTVLLWRLFRALVGPRPWLWLVLVGYAFSPYLVPGMAALNSGLGLGISQACLAGAMLAQVRYTRERRLVDAGVVALLVLVMLAFAQQSLPAVVFLPLLSFVFLQQGTWRERVRAGLSLWRGWLLLAAAGAVFASLYLTGDYNSPASDFTLGDGLWLTGQAWLTVLGPSLLGGPWQYYSFPSQWSAYADAPLVLVVLGQVVLVGLIALSVRRTGWLALVAWFIPAWIAVASLVLVGVGRWSWIGDLIPSALRYSYYVPLALALGLVLAFGAKPEGSRSGRRIGDTWFDARRRRALMGGATALLLVLSAFSTVRFANRFSENPAEAYAAKLLSDAAERGPGVQVHDTLLPEPIVPFVSQMHVSDLMALGGVPAEFGGQSNGRLIADGRGALVPAKFVKVANFKGPRQPACGIRVYGSGTTRIPLESVTSTREWFLQLELYQPHANRVTMTVLDEAGDEIPIANGAATLDLKGSLVVLHRRLQNGIPAVIELKSTDPGTNFCLVHTYLGAPVP